MGLTYYKRFRMEIELPRQYLPEPILPAGYRWLPWAPELLGRHAWTKFQSFRGEIDAEVFQSLSHLGGCQRLMSEITQRNTFLPQVTWLVTRSANPLLRDREAGEDLDCATIQGLIQAGPLGSIQNVGVIPEQRGLGLGRAVVLKSLIGFREAGIKRVFLEVTARNIPALQLYRSLGFRLTKTSYRAVESPEESLIATC